MYMLGYLLEDVCVGVENVYVLECRRRYARVLVEIVSGGFLW